MPDTSADTYTHFGLVDLTDKPAKVCSDLVVKNDKLSKDSKTPVPNLEVKTWFEKVFGDNITLSATYLLDKTSPWTTEASRIVFQPQGIAFPLGPQDKVDIIRYVGETVMQTCPEKLPCHPLVHFEAEKVCISGLSEDLMEAFWKSPPHLRGRPMKIVSRAFPFGNIAVSFCHGVPSQTLTQLREDLKPHINDSVRLVLASVYQISGMIGGPVFSGELVFFADRGWNIPIYGKRVLGLPCTLHDYYSSEE